ncbi:MAG: putative glycoside hydrolase [Clostridiales bacterium]|nr:putative glycoside hydrolase [Clostridiales bacterium]
MKKENLRIFVLILSLALLLLGCGRLRELDSLATTPAPIVVDMDGAEESGEDTAEEGLPEELAAMREAEGADALRTPAEDRQDVELVIDGLPARTPVKVKGIYISAYVAGTADLMENVIAEIDRTEANALVIDLKDDYGRVVCEMDAPTVEELGSVKKYIGDIDGLMDTLEEHEIYAIARIPAFRDAWLGEVRPEWCVKRADGSVFLDRDGNAWVNPYKQEAWDYLVEIASGAKKLGFDEVQFDYVRFCTERGMQDCVFDEADTKGRSRTDIILEFMEYAYEKLREEGLFVSADVFGAIINSDLNAENVGQIYGEMAKHLDYISPMIYPSHYADGNYGIDHPDLHPYETVSAALEESRRELYFAGRDGDAVAVVRPWLQDFTASWLENYIPYGPAEVRTQIQALYDTGYDEWLLWDASCHYSWDGLLTPEAAESEAEEIAASRAVLPETTYAEPLSEDSDDGIIDSEEGKPFAEGAAEVSLEGNTEPEE